MAKQPRKPTLASLMAHKIDGLSQDRAMQLIGSIIDAGSDESSPAAIDYAYGLLDQLLANKPSERHACRAHYFRANIWSARRHASLDALKWPWKSNLIDSEILELRKAVAHVGFAKLHPLERAQILTNLGNILNHVGRFIEAIEYWDRALITVPNFAMACGNRGVGLGYYAGALYDPGHHDVFMVSAAQSLAQACDEDAVLESPHYEVALNQFAQRLSAIQTRYDIPRMTNDIDLLHHPMGRSRRER